MSAAPRKSSRTEPRMLGDTATPSKRRRLSATQKAALHAALSTRLQLYPRGYAASKSGPFHSRRAVLGLVHAGLMNLSATTRYATASKRARDLFAGSIPDETSPPSAAQGAGSRLGVAGGRAAHD
jgi:hypothetical protein